MGGDGGLLKCAAAIGVGAWWHHEKVPKEKSKALA